MKYLGDSFDIHTGGVDHIGVHHTNEIAQSEAASGKKFVNYWLHAAFLIIGNEAKMAKSGESFITLQKIIDRGFSPLSLRYLSLSTHYRSPLTFTWQSLEAAQNGLDGLYRMISKNYQAGFARSKLREKSIVNSYLNSFKTAFGDNLDMPKCLAITWKIMKDNSVSSYSKIAVAKEFDKVLGLKLLETARQLARIPFKIRQLVRRREELRTDKKFSEADKLRRNIEALGYSIEDMPAGPAVTRKDVF
ncbi:MAG: Cysteine--tRNA ligase [candidate division WS2 bacterium]|nr:Cysteine--tRNA ligase [Candidatus Lithacetigena glycinireducens]